MLSKHLVDLAVATLDQCSKQKTSCKNVLYRLRKEERGLSGRQWKLLYALVMQTRKYATLLKDTVDLLPESLRNSIYSHFESRRWLLWLFLYDLLLGKDEIGSFIIQEGLVLSRQDIDLLGQYLEIAKQRKPLTDQPFWQADNIYVYARVNLVKSSLESILSNLERSGYRNTTREDKNVKQKCCFECNEFWLDSVVTSLFVFPSQSKIAQHSLVRKRRELVIQDKSSCFVAQGFNALLGWKVLDACAAPGNKSMHLISKGIEQYGEAFYSNPIRVIAIDRDKERFSLLNRNIRDYGYESFIYTQNVDFMELKNIDCQAIILDPSCSGSGLLKRNWTDDLDNPQQKKGADSNRLKLLSCFQRKMLLHALCDFDQCCRVTYSTCSIEKDENELVVYEVLHKVKDLGWKLVEFLPQWPRRGYMDPLNAEEAAACVRTDPKSDHTNGFFIACFERRLSKRRRLNRYN